MYRSEEADNNADDKVEVKFMLKNYNVLHLRKQTYAKHMQMSF